MPLTANSRLGPYEIKSTLGAGGMGEVYRARDSRLNRDVAIKVLREDGSTPDLRSRFEREARAVAALNHPNIIAVYDFGIEGGQQYIVTELLEGESLRSLLPGSTLKAKPVPARRLIEIATQVADGLATAHSAGIVHRDLKPENIMLGKDGRVKILDFGLARQSPTARSQRKATGEEETVAPTAEETKHLTSEGAVLGTASYMSPEQALGKEVDYRSDQFSFGLILHEMASGKQAFARNSSVETMAAIVRDEPSSIEEKIPAPLKWIIDRCLHKEPEQRYESTRDLFHELQNLREHFSEAYTSATFTPVGPTRLKVARRKTLAAVAASCLLLGGLLVYVLKPSGQDIGNYRYTPFASDAGRAVWSPDGKAVAYTGRVDGIPQAFLRNLNSPVPVQLTHENHRVRVLGWSSDGNHLIVAEDADLNDSAAKKLYSISVVGGDLDFIMDVNCETCDLSRNGKALATFAEGKAPGDPPTISISDPIGSPLRTYSPAFFASKEGAAEIAFSPDGTKILLLQRGDARKLEAWLLPYPAGGKPPQRALQRCPMVTYFNDSRSISWMPDNRHVVVSTAAGQVPRPHLWIADTESNDLTPLTTGNAYEDDPAVATDGQRLLYQQVNISSDILSVSVADGSAKTLISTGRVEFQPAWSAHAEKLAWVTERSGPQEIWLRTSDHAERPVVTAADFPDVGQRTFWSPALSPDGERLIFATRLSDPTIKLWIMSLAGGSPVRLTSVEHSNEGSPSWSPDGSRCVYLQFLAGKWSLMMVRTSGNAAPVELREDVLAAPNWSPTGDWITYRDEKGWNLISPDGKASKFLGRIESQYLAFARDGKLIYGLRTAETAGDPRRVTLFSLDPATLKQRTIKELGDELGMPHEQLEFSVAPDGKTIACSGFRVSSDLWMLQGYRQPGFWNQIKDALHFSNAR